MKFPTQKSKIKHKTMVLFSDKLGNEEEDQVAVMCDLESILTFYCKSRNVSYEPVS